MSRCPQWPWKLSLTRQLTIAISSCTGSPVSVLLKWDLTWRFIWLLSLRHMQYQRKWADCFEDFVRVNNHISYQLCWSAMEPMLWLTAPARPPLATGFRPMTTSQPPSPVILTLYAHSSVYCLSHSQYMNRRITLCPWKRPGSLVPATGLTPSVRHSPTISFALSSSLLPIRTLFSRISSYFGLCYHDSFTGSTSLRVGDFFGHCAVQPMSPCELT